MCDFFGTWDGTISVSKSSHLFKFRCLDVSLVVINNFTCIVD